MYPALENTSELKFCRDLAEAFVNKKLDDFNEVLQKRNQIYNLVRSLPSISLLPSCLHDFPSSDVSMSALACSSLSSHPPQDPFTVDLLLPIKEILKDGGEGEGAQPDIAVVGEGIEAEPDLS